MAATRALRWGLLAAVAVLGCKQQQSGTDATVERVEASAARSDPKRRYIIAPSVELSSEPATATRLWINTPVELVDVSRDLATVSLPGAVCDARGACRALEGTVQRADLADEPLTLQRAEQELAKAPSADRLLWAMRVVALDGTRREQRDAVVQALTAAGRASEINSPEFSNYLPEWGNPFWAVCYGTRAYLVGQAGRGASSAVNDADDEVMQTFARHARESLWYELGRNGPRRLSGNVFGAAKVIDEGGRKLVLLGDCPESSQGAGTFASFPFARIEPTPITDEAVLAGVRKHAKPILQREAELRVMRLPNGATIAGACRPKQSCFAWMMLDVNGQPIGTGVDRGRLFVRVRGESADLSTGVYYQPSFGEPTLVGIGNWNETTGMSGRSGVFLLRAHATNPSGVRVVLKADEA